MSTVTMRAPALDQDIDRRVERRVPVAVELR